MSTARVTEGGNPGRSSVETDRHERDRDTNAKAPREKAPLWSRWSYTFVKPLLDIRLTRPLEESDLYELDRADRIAVVIDKVTVTWNRELENANRNNIGSSKYRKPRLLRALFTAFIGDLLTTAVFTLMESGGKIAQPLLLKQLIQWLGGELGNQSTWYGWTIAGAMGCIAIFQTVVHHILFYMTMRCGWSMKMASSGMVHAKVLRLSSAAVQQTTQGQVINLVSNDVNRFLELGVMGQFSWAGMMDLAIILLLVSLELNFFAALAGVSTVLFFTPLQLWLGKRFGRTRVNTAIRTDQRIRVTAEVISSISSVKAYTWKDAFAALNTKLRNRERAQIERSQLIRSFNQAVSFASPVTASLASFLVYWAQGHMLEPGSVFASLGLLHILRGSLGMWSRAIQSIAEAGVSARRLRKFLMLPEADDKQNNYENALNGSSRIEPVQKIPGNVPEEPGKVSEEPKKIIETHEQNSHMQNNTISDDGNSRIEPAQEEPRKVLEEPKKDLEEGAPLLEFENAEFTWQTNEEPGVPTIFDINFSIRPGQLVAIVGPVGAGKSTLLEAILGEVPLTKGKFTFNKKHTNAHNTHIHTHARTHAHDRVAYVGQKPFIRASSFRENITFVGMEEENNSAEESSSGKRSPEESSSGKRSAEESSSGKRSAEEFSLERFNWAVSSCALDDDVRQLPHGVDTDIGEKGVNLSGGQKARVSLARALYSNATLVLLDDPLSAVDPKVARHLFEVCIFNELRGKGKAVILATHQVHWLQQADLVVVLDTEGRQVAAAPPIELQKKGIDLSHFEEEEEESPRRSRSRSRSKSAAQKDEIPTTDALQHNIHDMHKPSSNQSIVSIPSPVHMRSRSNSTALDELIDQQNVLPNANPNSYPSPIYSLKRANSSERHSINMLKHKENSTGSNIGRRNSRSSSTRSIKSDQMANPNSSLRTNTLVDREDRELGSVSRSTYTQFMKHGGICNTVSVCLLFGVSQTAFVMSDWWLRYWSDRTTQSEPWLAGVFGLLVASTMLLGLMRAALFARTSLKASSSVHTLMYSKVLCSPMSFFNSNPHGRVLNRFSSDQGQVDEMLPSVAYDAIEVMLFALSAVVLVCITLPYVALLIVPLAMLFYITRNRYLPAARDIKRLEAITRSPVFAEFGATLDGLTTLRAYHVLESTRTHFIKLLQDNGKAWYCYILVSRWVGFRLDLETAVFLICSTLCAAALKGRVDDGMVGFALLYSLTLSGQLQWAVRQAAEAENYMTAFERMLHYASLPCEHDNNSKAPETWPYKGEIQVTGLCVRYREDMPLVLKNVSFKIPPGHKVGVVGRTGSGKSSLILALLRLNQIQSGDIQVDGVSLLSMGLEDARKHISWIPQDPHLFSGTLRFNLDPFSLHSDTKLWDALERVRLKSIAESNSLGLSMVVSEGGLSLSTGQRQLLSLARASLLGNKIILMDEATANIDYETDELIQATLRDSPAFKDCTVITIAHRILSVIDSNTVMVMDEGELKEMGQPTILAEQPGSLFRRMLEDTGNAAVFRQLARDAALSQTSTNVPRSPGSDTNTHIPTPPVDYTIQPNRDQNSDTSIISVHSVSENVGISSIDVSRMRSIGRAELEGDDD